MRARRGLVFLGYYGAGNFGDDLMLRGLLSALSVSRYQDKITVVSYYDKPLPLNQIEQDQVSILRVRGTISKLIKLIPLFLRSRMAVFGGGTPFTATEGDGSYKFFRLAHLLGCRFGYLGVGIGRLESLSRRKRAAWLLRNCEIAVFRDPVSLARAGDLLGVSEDSRFFLAEDLCYLDELADNGGGGSEARITDSELLVISWRHLPIEETGIEPASLLEALLESMQELLRSIRISRIEVLPLDSTMDMEIHEDLLARLRERFPKIRIELNRGLSLSEKTSVIRRAALYLSVRLHGAFVGKLLGVPTVGFAYSPKVAYFFDGVGSKSVVDWGVLLDGAGGLSAAAECAMDESAHSLEIRSRRQMAETGLQALLRVSAP